MNSKKLYSFLCKSVIAVFIVGGSYSTASGQCGYAAGLGCAGTDHTNFGYNSLNPATLEYDNFVSSYHSTIVRNSEGDLVVWGERSAANGTGSRTSPTIINTTSFPGLTGVPLKGALGSNGGAVEHVILTTTGLFSWGTNGQVISTSLKGANAFGKISVSGKADGLPPGVTPDQVKMMFGTYKTLAIVTCSGEGWVLTS